MRHAEGVLDTNIVAVLSLFGADELPQAGLITAVTLGELSDAPCMRRPIRSGVLDV